MNHLRGISLLCICILIAAAAFVSNSNKESTTAVSDQVAVNAEPEPAVDECCDHTMTAAPEGVVAHSVDTPTPQSSAVDAIFTAYRAANTHKVSPAAFNALSGDTGVGQRVSFDLPGFTLSGTIAAHTEESTIKNLSVELEDGLGRALVAIHDSGKLVAHVLFNGESRALSILGNDANSWEMEATSVGHILCAPSDATYPLQGNAGFLAENANARQPISAQANFTQIALSSLPSSEYVLYIDFDGDTITHPWWNNGNPISSAPHPQAANDSWVTAVWQRVAEDFAPFDINVTTDRSVYNSTPIANRVICVATPTDTAQPNSGGVAFLGTFGDNVPCWAFNDTEYACADTISHEVGHTLGLIHDGLAGELALDPNDEYFDGHGSGDISWGSIMGAPFSGDNENVTQWSIGEYTDAVSYVYDAVNDVTVEAPNTQDDLAVIISNGFGYRADDSVDTPTNLATGLNTVGAIIEDSGVIETTGDIDFFRFSTIGGLFEITASPLDVDSQEGEAGSETMGANLAVEVVLYDDLGDPILSDNPDDILSASISTILEEGEYYVSIQGVGRGDPLSTGFSDYASLGQYFLSGILARGPLSIRGGDDLTTLVQDGDTTPSRDDGTALGLTSIETGAPLNSLFAFTNDGTEEITIASIGFSGTQFAFDTLTPLVVNAGLTLDLTLSFTPTDIGIVQEQVTVTYFRESEPGTLLTYEFTVQAVVTKTEADDNYEDNDNYFEAFPFPGQIRLVNIAGDGRQSDNDWYQINVVPGLNEITVTCDFENILGNINIALYDTRGYFLASSETEEDQEQITYLVNETGGAYYIRVYGDNLQNTYDLYWEGLSPVIFVAGDEDNYEPNNSYFAAENITAAKGSTLSSIDGQGVQYNNDWYRLDLAALENVITVAVTNGSSTGSIFMDLHDSRGYRLGVAASDGVFEELTYKGAYGATYYLRVYGDNIGGTYDITYTGADEPDAISSDDAYEENDNFFAPYDFNNASGLALSSFSGEGYQFDPDWYQVRSEDGENVIRLTVHSADPDLTFSIYDSRGYQLTTLSSLEEGQIVLLRVDLAQANAYIVVDGPDAGGAYDFTWESLFAPEGDDIYEENDTLETAFDLSARENEVLSRVSEVGIQGDDDWYQIRAQAGDAAIRARITFTNLMGNIDLALHDSTGALIATAESSTDDEVLAVEIPLATEDVTYYLRVYGANAGNEYDLTWSATLNLDDDEYEPNNSFEEAFALTPVTAGLLSDISGLGVQADSDYYSLEVPAGATGLQVFASFLDIDGDIDIAVFNDQLELEVFSISITNNEFVRLGVNPDVDSRFYIWVFFADAGNEYDLEWTYTFATVPGTAATDTDRDNVGDAWENKYFGRLSAISGESNSDNDKLPNWAEYALNTSPLVADSGILKPYVDGDYMYVKYFRSAEAAAAGYQYTVKESGDLSFSDPSVLSVHQVISHGEYDEVIYRSSRSVQDAGQCFFFLEVNKPAP